MENTPLSKRSIGFGLAVAITALVNSIIVVIKEKNTAVMNGMKSLLGHHWTTQSAIIVVLFLVLGIALGRGKPGSQGGMNASRLISTVVVSVVVAALIIIGFYLFVD